MEDSANYDLNDSYAMGLSYFEAMLYERDDDIDAIEGLMDPTELSGAFLQLNIVLLGKLLALIPEETVADGPAYIELLRSEHAARVAAKQTDGA